MDNKNKYAKYCCESPSASYSDDYVHTLQKRVKELEASQCTYTIYQCSRRKAEDS